MMLSFVMMPARQPEPNVGRASKGYGSAVVTLTVAVLLMAAQMTLFAENRSTLESLAERGRGAGLVVIGGQDKAGDGIEVRASRTPLTRLAARLLSGHALPERASDEASESAGRRRGW